MGNSIFRFLRLPVNPENWHAVARRLFMVMLRGTLSVLIVMAACAVSVSPRTVSGNIVGVAIAGVRISGHGLECGAQPEASLVEQCHMTLEGQTLELTVEYQDSSRYWLERCTAVYEGQVVSCQPTSFVSGDKALYARVDSDLGLSSAHLSRLRLQNILVNLGEAGWTTVTRAVAAALALSVALVIWQIRISRAGLVLLALVGSATAFVFAERALIIALVLLGFID